MIFAMTSAGNKTVKSDILKRSELFCCALAALGLHILLVLIFCKEENGTPAPVTVTGSRTNILFSENDPKFKGICQKINAEPDPAQFIRGGSTGYSSCCLLDAKPLPESKIENAELPRKTIPEKAAGSVEPELSRTYAELVQYTPGTGNRKTTPPERNDHAGYPVWKDAFGIIQNFNPFYGAHNRTIHINSSAAGSPTILKIQFPKRKTEKIPVLVTIHSSCGDTFLDDYAKKILLERLADAAVLKKFNPEYNDTVSVYWQPDLKAVETESFPKNMFPGDDL